MKNKETHRAIPQAPVSSTLEERFLAAVFDDSDLDAMSPAEVQAELRSRGIDTAPYKARILALARARRGRDIGVAPILPLPDQRAAVPNATLVEVPQHRTCLDAILADGAWAGPAFGPDPTVVTLNGTAYGGVSPRITVLGIGGAGVNAIENMLRARLVGCKLVACNTDQQALGQSTAPHKILLGQTLTRGLGAGSDPDIGRRATEESAREVLEHLRDVDMLFITAGMGGGTGTGGAPVIAKLAREQGILTVGVVSRPFAFMGERVGKRADAGLETLMAAVDTLLVIRSDRALGLGKHLQFKKALQIVDDVLYQSVRAITDLLVLPGTINIDFADLRTVMSSMGTAVVGTGEASGPKRASDAAECAINNPLIDSGTIAGARAVVVNITTGADLKLVEVETVANRVRSLAHQDANLIIGSAVDDGIGDAMRVTLVATGISPRAPGQGEPVTETIALSTDRDHAAVAKSAEAAKAFKVKAGVFSQTRVFRGPAVPFPKPRFRGDVCGKRQQKKHRHPRAKKAASVSDRPEQLAFNFNQDGVHHTVYHIPRSAGIAVTDYARQAG